MVKACLRLDSRGGVDASCGFECGESAAHPQYYFSDNGYAGFFFPFRPSLLYRNSIAFYSSCVTLSRSPFKLYLLVSFVRSSPASEWQQQQWIQSLPTIDPNLALAS